MARLWQSGFELNTLSSYVEFYSSGTSQEIVTSPVRSGTYALWCHSIAAETGYVETAYRTEFSGDRGNIFFRFYFRLASIPSGSSMEIFRVVPATGDAIAIDLNNDQTLTLWDNHTNTQIGTTAALILNQWYRLEVNYNDTTQSNTTFTANIDGVSIGSSSFNGTTGSAVGPQWAVVWGNANGGGSYDYYLDDLAINDSTGSFQNSYPGEGHIVHLRPNGVGDSAQWTPNLMFANWAMTDEVTPNDATDYNSSTTLNFEDLFACDNLSDPVGTINVVAVGVRMTDLVAPDATAAFKLEIEKTSAGTKAQSAAIKPGDNSWLTNTAREPRNYSLVTYQDPDGANWTHNTLNSMQIGYIQTATNVRAIAISTIWASVDYNTDVTGPFPTYFRV